MFRSSRGRAFASFVLPCAAVLALQCSGDDDADPNVARGGARAEGGLSAGGVAPEPAPDAGASGAAVAGGGANSAGGASPRGDGGALIEGGSAGENVGGANGPTGPRCQSKLTVKCRLPQTLYEPPEEPNPRIPPWVAAFSEVLDVQAINSHQQVVGRRDCDGQQHASLIEGNRTTDLLESLNDFSSYAADINDSGVIVGSVWLTENARGLPYIWQNGEITVLSDSRLGGAIAINNRGQVLLSGTTEAQSDFLWDDGSLTEIGADLRARGLDDAGRVVGETVVESPQTSTGFVWQNGRVSKHTEFASIRASNTSEQLAGIAPNGRAVLWDGQNLVELPEDFGFPIGLNDRGTVLGGYGHEPEPPPIPSRVYDQGIASVLPGPFYDLYAQDISQNGNMVARTAAIVYVPGPGGCRFEACERFAYYSVVWSAGCFGSCCATGDAGGAGGGHTVGPGD